MAVIYMFVITLYSAITDKNYFVLDKIGIRVLWLSVFLLATCLFSIVYYGVPVGKVMIVARTQFYALSWFFLRKLNYKQLFLVLQLLGLVTLISSFLYLFEPIIGQPLLFTNTEEGSSQIEYNGGLVRFANIPPLRTDFFLLTLFTPYLWAYRLKLSRIAHIIVYTVSVILSFGRTMIITTFSMLICGALMQKQNKRVRKQIIVIGIVLLPIASIFLTSMSERNTLGDLEEILAGDFRSYTTGYTYGKEETTMLFRFAWVYERAEYLSHRPLIESIMGLAYISDQDPMVWDYYHFDVNDYGNKNMSQIIYSYDISWGNFITRFGILGTVLMLSLWLFLLRFFWKTRNNPFGLVGFLMLICVIITSFAGINLSSPGSFIKFFIIYLLIQKQKDSQLNLLMFK